MNRPAASVTGVALKFTSGPAVGVASLNAADPASVLIHRVAFIDIKKASDCDGAPGRRPDGPRPAQSCLSAWAAF